MKQFHRVACLILLVAAVIVGSSAQNAFAMESDAVARMQRNISENCPSALVAQLSDASCSGEDNAPARQPGCPIKSMCVNMASGTTHCGLVAVTDEAIFPDFGSTAISVVFRSDEIRATGLLADAISQPPIL